MRLGDILGVLRDAYCRTVGVEYMHIQEPAQKRWIQEHVEGVSTQLDADEHRWILDRLNAAEALEQFLNTKYIGQKRFGLEGGESAIPLIDAVLDDGRRRRPGGGRPRYGPPGPAQRAHQHRREELRRAVRGVRGQHRSRDGAGFRRRQVPQGFSGQVHRADRARPSTWCWRPTRRIWRRSTRSWRGWPGPCRISWKKRRASVAIPVLPLLIHGDAAFAGQGVVAETLNMSALPGYETGGTVHLVINNQLGFTTNPASARSSVYATDVAKMVQAPIFHVNGDDPEACVRVGRLAFAFRQAFHKDVVIDLVCYRRYGHNEQDDPSLTQPLLYQLIKEHRSVRKLYTETLVRRGDITIAEAEEVLRDFSQRLQAALDETRAAARPTPTVLPPPPPPAPVLPPIETGVPAGGAAAGGRRPGHASRRASRCTPSWCGCSRTGPSCGPAARPTGPSARPWPTAPCCSKAGTCAWPGRTPGGARSGIAMPPWWIT